MLNENNRQKSNNGLLMLRQQDSNLVSINAGHTYDYKVLLITYSVPMLFVCRYARIPIMVIGKTENT